jgi:CubicO group peptidase (beta-lactamase class C family)
MMKTSTLVMRILLACSCTMASAPAGAASQGHSAESVIPVTPALGALRKALLATVERGELSSLTIGLVQENKIPWLEGLGWADRAAKVAATPDTVYPIASVSKSITATVAALMVEKGRLRWEDEVATRLPGVARGVTLRQLVEQTSGLPHLWWYEYAGDAESTLRRDRILAAARTTAFPPGTGFLYSNLNLEIVVEYLESALGEPFEALARRELLGPLGMVHTTTEAWIGHDPVVKGYVAGGAVPFAYRLAPRGGAGFFSSVRDLLRFARFHLGALPSARGLLSSSALAEIHGEGTPAGARGYSHGWLRIPFGGDDVALLADGEVLGGAAAILLLPRRQIAVVLVTNTFTDLLETAIAVAEAAMPGSTQGLSRAFEQDKARLSSAGVMPTGGWTGTLDLNGSMLSIAVDFSAQPKPTLRLGEEKRYVLDHMNWTRGLLEFSSAADLPLPSDKGRGHELRLVLHVTEDTLDGFVTDVLSQDIAHRHFGAPYAVHLTRAFVGRGEQRGAKTR